MPVILEDLVAAKKLYSIQELAILTSQSEQSIRLEVWAGKLPAVRKGRRLFITAEEVDRYVRSFAPYEVAEEAQG